MKSRITDSGRQDNDFMFWKMIRAEGFPLFLPLSPLSSHELQVSDFFSSGGKTLFLSFFLSLFSFFHRSWKFLKWNALARGGGKRPSPWRFVNWGEVIGIRQSSSISRSSVVFIHRGCLEMDDLVGCWTNGNDCWTSQDWMWSVSEPSWWIVIASIGDLIKWS